MGWPSGVQKLCLPKDSGPNPAEAVDNFICPLGNCLCFGVKFLSVITVGVMNLIEKIWLIIPWGKTSY
jgi:hypothetical protein